MNNTAPTLEEALSVLFRIVRTSSQGFAIGHDVMVAARSVVRRAYPDAYRDLERRRRDKNLPPQDSDEVRMKLTINPTSRIVSLLPADARGIQARIWEGTTARGIPIMCLISRVSVHRDQLPGIFGGFGLHPAGAVAREELGSGKRNEVRSFCRTYQPRGTPRKRPRSPIP